MLLGRGFAQDLVKLVFQSQFFFFQGVNLFIAGRDDACLHIFDLLVELIVFVKQTLKTGIFGLEFANQVAILWKHEHHFRQKTKK